MEYTAFRNKVLSGIQEILGDKVQVECSSVKKNNGIILQGVSITQGPSNLSPTIYLDDFYAEFKRGKTIGTIVCEVIKVYKKCKTEDSLDMKFFSDFGQMRERIVYKLIHGEKNKELLKEVPHIRFLDLAIVFYCMIGNEIITGATVLINHQHCRVWGKGSRELLQEAERNTPRLLKYELKSMEVIMQEIFADNLKQEFRNSVERNLEDEIRFDMTEEWIDKVAAQMIQSIKGTQGEVPMYVLSNQAKAYGAVGILYPGVLKDVAAQLGEDVFILPSSIHEVILVPAKKNISNEKLADMVKEVNESQVMEEEVLSDEIYLYSRTEDKIRMKSGMICW